METIEKAVKLSEAVKVFDIIECVLKEERSTQVLVSSALYLELYKNGKNYGVYHSHLVKTSHYNDAEEWLNHATDKSLNEPIHLASFIKNCAEYMQLVQFEASDLNYDHFDLGLKQILFIEVEK